MVCPEFNDSTSFYRAAGPFSQLRKIMDIELKLPRQISWSDILLCDAVFSLRPCSPEHLKLICAAKDLKKPVWVDFDDDFSSIPKANPASKVYNNDKVQSCVKDCISLADIVTVTTGFLKERLAILNKNIVVVPNAIDTDILPPRQKESNQVVLWRGSATHDEDLNFYTTEIVEIAKKYPNMSFEFLGFPFWNTMNQMPKENTKILSPVDIPVYFHALSTIRPKVMQVPLMDSPFNRSKSNIAYLEGCYGGAVTLAPDWNEWRHPGCVGYKSKDDYWYQLEQIIQMSPSDAMSASASGWEYILDTLTLSKVNKIRKEILENLFN